MGETSQDVKQTGQRDRDCERQTKRAAQEEGVTEAALSEDCGKGPCHDTVVRAKLTKWELRVEEGEQSPDVATLAGGQVSKCRT